MRKTMTILVAFFTGSIGFFLIFNIPAPFEYLLFRLALFWILFFTLGFFVGLNEKSKWSHSGFIAGAPFLYGIVLLIKKIFLGTTPPYWSAALSFLIPPVIFSLFGGYIGARIRRHGIKKEVAKLLKQRKDAKLNRVSWWENRGIQIQIKNQYDFESRT